MPKTRVKMASSPLKESLTVPSSEVKSPTKPTKRKAPLVKKNTALKSNKKVKSKKVSIKRDEDTVTLPPSASLRLLEKVNLYKIWYRDTLPLQVTSSARFFGYLFIGLGTLFAASSHFMHTELPPGVAALVCSSGACEEVADNALPAEAPVIRFLNELPKEVTTDIDFVIEAQNTDNYKVFLTNLQTGVKTELQPTSKTDKTKFLVVTDSLNSGDYKIEATADVNDVKYIFTGSVFTYRSANVVVEPIIAIPEVNETDPASTTSEVESISIKDIDTGTETVSLDDTIDIKDELEIESDIEIKEVIADSKKRSPVSIAIEANIDSKSLVITTGDFSPSRVDIYSRIVNTEPEIYLGQAYLMQGKWFFSLSAFNLPNTDQQLFAKFSVDGVTKKTEAVSIPPQTDATLATNTNDDLEIKKRKVDLALEALDLSNGDRKNYYTNNATNTIDVKSEEQFIDLAVIDAVNETLRAEATILNTYFFHYGVAYQGSKLFLLNLAEQEINKYSTILANKIALNLDEIELAPAIETVINSRFAKLMGMVKVNEDLFATETNNLIKQDSDNDGLSDYDELTNFLTDPANPDSDYDSIIEGVEFVMLANPLLSDLQKYPTLKQRLHSQLPTNDVVSITQSKILVVETGPGLSKHTEYMIEGKGIPNSFVYILDSTNDILGIIKTNTAGEFFYTIDQPNIASHSVIKAAIVDQSGELVSISQDFEYNNPKNQLVAAVSDMMFGDEELSTRLTSFNVLTGSIGLVALGFVLLMLAQSIKTRRRNLVLKDLDFAVSQ